MNAACRAVTRHVHSIQKSAMAGDDDGGSASSSFRPWRPLSALYRAKLIAVEPALFLYMLGSYIYIPLYEQYIYQDYGSHLLEENASFSYPQNGSFCITNDLLKNYTGDDTYKKDDAFSNHLVVYGQLASKIPGVIITIIFGPLTDRYGRKIGLIFPAIGGLLQGLLSIFLVWYKLDPYYFILANFLNGIFGDITCILAASFSYVADVGSVRWRSLRIGILEFTLSFGAGIGQFFGGFWLQKINCNFIPPMCFTVACNLFIIAYVLTLVPESLTRSERKTLQSKKPKGLKTYVEGFRLFCGRLSPILTWNLWVALIAVNVLTLNFMGSMIISVYFLTSPPFNFNSLQIGIYQSVRSASQGLSNILVTGALVACQVTDRWIMLIGYLFHSVCSLLLGFSSEVWQVYTIAVFKGVEGIVFSGARGLMSKLVKAKQQGALFSVIASMESLFWVLSNALWPIVYPVTLLRDMKSGMTYIFMGLLGATAIPLILSLFIFRKEDIVPTVRRDLVESSYYEGDSEDDRASSASEEEYKPLLDSTTEHYNYGNTAIN